MDPITAALAPIIASLAAQIGVDAAEFIAAFVGGFIKLRLVRGERAFVLPQLVHWWMVAAKDQHNADGTPFTDEQKHAYVKNLITLWAQGEGVDLKSSFKDALIKMGWLKMLQDAGTEAIKVTTQVVVDEAKK